MPAKKSAPRSKREWIVFRAGVREGIELAHADAHVRAEQFLNRFDVNGVELSTPSAADAADRSRVKTPAEFTPQLKRKKTA